MLTIHANLSVEEVEALSPENFISYLNTKKEKLFLRDIHINSLAIQEVSGRNFAKLTRDDLLTFPYNLPGGPAQSLSELIIELNSQRLINLQGYLSYTIPFISYSPHGTADKSTTKAKANGDPPRSVRLWDDFLDQVNGYIFDQEKKFKRPTFVTNFIVTCEEIVRNAFNVNVCGILNDVLQDVQFALWNKGTGKPDFSCHLIKGDKSLFQIEIKRFNTGDLDIPDLYNHVLNEEEDNDPITEASIKVKQIVQQLYNYMIESKNKYGSLSSYDECWFVKRDNGTLFFSKVVKHNSTDPTVLKSYAYLVELAKKETHSSDPRIIEQTDSSPYPFRKPRRDDDSSSSQDPTRKSQSFSRQSSSGQKRSSEQSSSSISKRQRYQGRRHMTSQSFNYSDFEYKNILSAGENKKILECEVYENTIILKSTDLTKKPKCLDEFLNEVEIYRVLAKLQDICIPKLLFYGDLAKGMSFVMGMTNVGTTLGHHKIDRRLKNRAITALRKIHNYNVLHNDIREENILINEKGYVYIIDFGLSIQTDNESLFHLEEAELDRLLNIYM